MPRRDRLRELLSSGGKCLVFPLTGRGFASEINNLLLALLYCLSHRLRFRLDTEHWNASHSLGWTDYFLPFCDESRAGNPRDNAGSLTRRDQRTSRLTRVLHRASSGDLHGNHIWLPMRSRVFLDQHFAIPELGISGDIFHAKAELLSLIWAFNPATLEAIRSAEAPGLKDSGYVGVHIRRGDKVAASTKEADAVETHRYVSLACRFGAPQRKAFLASDDIHAINEFRGICPSDWVVNTRCRRDSIGHLQRAFNSQPADIRFSMTLDLIIDIQLLADADVFLGTYSSNIGRFIHLLRGGVDCHSLDSPWHPR